MEHIAQAFTPTVRAQANQLDSTSFVSTHPNKKGLSIASLFSGAGGMDIGFEKAGFKSVWANEYDKSIAPSFKQYFPETVFDGRSICDIPNDDLPNDVVGVIGGPPCQSWSEAGARHGIYDRMEMKCFGYVNT